MSTFAHQNMIQPRIEVVNVPAVLLMVIKVTCWLWHIETNIVAIASSRQSITVPSTHHDRAHYTLYHECRSLAVIISQLNTRRSRPIRCTVDLAKQSKHKRIPRSVQLLRKRYNAITGHKSSHRPSSQAKAFGTLCNEVLTRRAAKRYDPQSLAMCAALLELNPEMYSAWNYRREALVNVLRGGDDSATEVCCVEA